MSKDQPPGSGKDTSKLPPIPTVEILRHQLTNIDSEGPAVTQRELWSYFLYFQGNNGTAVSIYSLTIFQRLANEAGFDSMLGPGHPCNSSATCVVPWGGGTKTVSSLVLIGLGLLFAIDTVFFIVVGSLSDYGNLGRWILLGLTVIYWAAQMSSMALVGPADWRAAMGIWVLSGICYTTSQTLFLAYIPSLGRNMTRTRASRQKYENGTISFAEYELAESLEKNQIGNVVEVNRNVGCLVVLLLSLSLLIPLSKHPLVDNYTIVLCNAYWILIGIWWFVFQQPRPRPTVPGNPLTLGVRQESP
jgi:MFS-type transporter involved in bile tolerance (Atg22 family)